MGEFIIPQSSGISDGYTGTFGVSMNQTIFLLLLYYSMCIAEGEREGHERIAWSHLHTKTWNILISGQPGISPSESNQMTNRHSNCQVHLQDPECQGFSKSHSVTAKRNGDPTPYLSRCLAFSPGWIKTTPPSQDRSSFAAGIRSNRPNQ
jgi:hypothetical protein